MGWPLTHHHRQAPLVSSYCASPAGPYHLASEAKHTSPSVLYPPVHISLPGSARAAPAVAASTAVMPQHTKRSAFRIRDIANLNPLIHSCKTAAAASGIAPAIRSQKKHEQRR